MSAAAVSRRGGPRLPRRGRVGGCLRGAGLALLLLLLAAPSMARAAEVVVFAAASLTEALTDIGVAYQQSSPDTIRFSFAASSTLARQIAQGAPADIYVSANERWMDYVAREGRLVEGSRVDIVGNRLVLVAPLGSAIDKVRIAPGFALVDLLGAGRLAMGNPAHVPAGIYARQSLQALGLWRAVQGKVARAADVRAALALVALGEVPLGIVYRTDALASGKVKVVGTFPDSSHRPIVYPAARIRHAAGSEAATRDFFRFLQSDTAASIFRRYGFKVLR